MIFNVIYKLIKIIWFRIQGIATSDSNPKMGASDLEKITNKS